MTMHNNEAPGDNWGESALLEAELLRDELADLFRDNIDQSALLIPDDFDQPAEVILAGTYQMTETEHAEFSVQQRVDETGPIYLIRHSFGSDNTYYLITGSSAKSVWMGMPDLAHEDVRKVRDLMQPDAVKWDKDLAQLEADERSLSNPFMWVDGYSRTAK